LGDLFVTPRVDPDELAGRTAVAEVLSTIAIGPPLFVNHKPFRLGLEHERELQAVTSARFVEQLIGVRRLHAVVAGDFDAVPDAASMRFWRGLQSLDGTSVCYRDAREHTRPGDPGHTFTSGNPLVTAGKVGAGVVRAVGQP
jgi:hypothetical protein